jgi:hypothetical protein
MNIVAERGSGCNDVSAAAGCCHCSILGMNFFLHGIYLYKLAATGQANLAGTAKDLTLKKR